MVLHPVGPRVSAALTSGVRSAFLFRLEALAFVTVERLGTRAEAKGRGCARASNAMAMKRSNGITFPGKSPLP